MGRGAAPRRRHALWRAAGGRRLLVHRRGRQRRLRLRRALEPARSHAQRARCAAWHYARGEALGIAAIGAYAVEAATPLCAAARARGFTSIQLWDEACTAEQPCRLLARDRQLPRRVHGRAARRARQDAPRQLRRRAAATYRPQCDATVHVRAWRCDQHCLGRTGPYQLLNCHGTARELPVHVATAAPDAAPRCEVQSEGARHRRTARRRRRHRRRLTPARC